MAGCLSVPSIVLVVRLLAGGWQLAPSQTLEFLMVACCLVILSSIEIAGDSIIAGLIGGDLAWLAIHRI